MKKHIVNLRFVYDDPETYPDVTDRESAINQAIKELDEIPIQSFSFDYEQQDEEEERKFWDYTKVNGFEYRYIGAGPCAVLTVLVGAEHNGQYPLYAGTHFIGTVTAEQLKKEWAPVKEERYWIGTV